MDEDSNYDEEEQEHKVITINDRAAYDTLLSDRKKVVVVVFLLPGNSNCDSTLKWMKTASRESTGDSVLFGHLSPTVLPDIARENNLNSVPTFAFYWRQEQQYTFSGTNPDKIKAALGKALQKRHETLAEEAKWHNTVKVMGGNNLAKSDKVHILEILDTPKIIIGCGWTLAEYDDPSEKREPFDMNLYAFMTTEQNRVNSLTDIVSNSNKQQHNVKYFGNSRKGEDGEGDDASWDVYLEEPQMPPHIHDIVFCGLLTDKKMNLSQVSSMYIRGFDYEQGKCLFKYDIELETSNENCVYFGKVYRTKTGQKWKFMSQGDVLQTTYEEIEAKLTEVDKKKPKKKKGGTKSPPEGE